MIVVYVAKYVEVVIHRNEVSRKAFFKKRNILYPQTFFLETFYYQKKVTREIFQRIVKGYIVKTFQSVLSL